METIRITDCREPAVLAAHVAEAKATNALLWFDMSLAELQPALGMLSRTKRPFAFSTLDSATKEQLAQLQSLIARRKLHVYLLDGWHVLPPIAALKEILSGGTIGTLSSLKAVIHSSQQTSWQYVARIPWLVDWLCEGYFTPSTSMERNVVEIADETALETMQFECTGATGSIRADISFANGTGVIYITRAKRVQTRVFDTPVQAYCLMQALLAMLPNADSLPGLTRIPCVAVKSK